MCLRFATATLDPLIEAQQRFLRRNEDVEKYYRDKMFLLRQLSLPDENIIAQLTAGMPSYYKYYLAGFSGKPTEWLLKSKQLENNRQQKSFKNNSSNPQASLSGTTTFKAVHLTHDSNATASSSHGNQSQVDRQLQSNNSRVRRKLPRCFFCKFLNKTAFHFHKDCPNRPQDRQNEQQSINSQDHSFRQSESNQEINLHLTSMQPQVLNFVFVNFLNILLGI